MLDGTSRHLTYFDQLAKDEGYAGNIETDMKQMVSSHRIKRFFKAFAWTRAYLFRRLLQMPFFAVETNIPIIATVTSWPIVA